MSKPEMHPFDIKATRKPAIQRKGANMKGVIRLGDATTHGGKVVAVYGAALVHNIAVARKGDACICPINGHSPCVIAEGDPEVLIAGVPVAFEGHKTSCGATLISSAATSVRE